MGPRVDLSSQANEADKQADFQQKLERIKSMQQKNRLEASGATTPQQPIEQPINTAISGQVAKPGAEDDADVNMNEDEVTNKIPISQFQSNNIAKK